MMNKRTSLILLTSIILTACSTSTRAPITSIWTDAKSTGLPSAGEIDAQVYVMKAGDTLYSIAKRSGIDLATLKRLNKIDDTTQLPIGTRLVLSTDALPVKAVPQQAVAPVKKSVSAVKTVATTVKPKVTYYVMKKGDSLYGIAKRFNTDVASLKRLNNISDTRSLPIGTRLIVREGAVPAVATVAEKKTTTQKITSSTASKGTWMWPTSGKVVTLFDKSTRGINIVGKEGQPVYAAASGEVSYSGNDLRGYGNLILIKHANEYLTAYAHNQKLLVRKGDKVKKGQMIATLGKTEVDTGVPTLHFEIRYKGVAEDPLKLLPKTK